MRSACAPGAPKPARAPASASAPRTAVPKGLGPRGRTFWRKVQKVYELDLPETELLIEVCRALDECEALQSAIAEQGHTVDGSRGQVVAHPALVELRQTRQVLGRLLAQLSFRRTSVLRCPHRSRHAPARPRRCAGPALERRHAVARRRETAAAPAPAADDVPRRAVRLLLVRSDGTTGTVFRAGGPETPTYPTAAAAVAAADLRERTSTDDA